MTKTYMPRPWPENYAFDITRDNDQKNLAAIEAARSAGRINDEAAKYLSVLYRDGMEWLREVFVFLGKCFGAPKSPIRQYDYTTDSAVGDTMTIVDINPLFPYIVSHRLDMDPMRNQFFTSGRGHKIDLAVSSIVTVIVGAQKNVNRALDKITGKYYAKYVNEVCDTVYNVIASHDREASARAISDKVRKKLNEKYISAASETVLSIIGSGHENIAVELVRALDQVKKPRMHLQDVWRVKCLFDLVPQARTFIERVREMMPERVLSVKDSFYDMENPRNYRDAKLVINIGTSDEVVPMEIMCQVRTFFEFEKQTHKKYETARRRAKGDADAVDGDVAALHDAGTKEYNLMVCHCLEELFERVGWNILYSQNNKATMFDGFPKKCTLHYPPIVLERIMSKVDDAIKNEIFDITNAPSKLTPAQKYEIFRFLTEFILVAAMPYNQADWQVPSDTMAGKLFNFVMKEVQRYYKKQDN